MSEKIEGGPWTVVGNSWQYTTVYAADGRPVCCLDLEDWGVDEDNQEELEAEQARVASLIGAAPEMLAALDHIGGLSRALRQGGPDPMDLEGLSDALSEAVDLANALVAKATGGAS